MKALMVGLLLLVLGLNSNANGIFGLQKNLRMPVDVGVPNTYFCEIRDADSKGSFTQIFTYTLNESDKSFSVSAITTVRDAQAKKSKDAEKVATRILVPGNDLYRLKFGGRLNREKSEMLIKNFQLCKSNEYIRGVQQAITIQQQQNQQDLKVGYVTGALDSMSDNQLRAFALGREVGQIKGMTMKYLQEFEAEEEIGVGAQIKDGLRQLEKANGASATNAARGGRGDSHSRPSVGRGAFDSSLGAGALTPANAEQYRLEQARGVGEMKSPPPPPK